MILDCVVTCLKMSSLLPSFWYSVTNNFTKTYYLQRRKYLYPLGQSNSFTLQTGMLICHLLKQVIKISNSVSKVQFTVEYCAQFAIWTLSVKIFITTLNLHNQVLALFIGNSHPYMYCFAFSYIKVTYSSLSINM